MRPASSGICFYTLLRLLREEQKERSSWWRGDWIAAHRADRTGVLLPHEVYVEILLDRLYKDIQSGRTRFLIDGFPRNLEHDVLFAQYVRAQALLGAEADDWPQRPNVRLIISFECNIEASVQRVVYRGKSSGGSEDREDMVRQRYRSFQKGSAPLIEKFEGRALLRRVSI